jgi:glycerate 2-kinase
MKRAVGSVNRSAGLLPKAEKIYKAALASVSPETLIRKSVAKKGGKLLVQGKSFDLDSYRNIFLIAFGKAAPYLAAEAANILEERLTAGISTCLPGQKFRLKRITFIPAAHPLPDERSLKAARQILELAHQAGEGDLVLVLISGGGSAQVCLPVPGVSLEEKRTTTEKLLKRGADIVELNTVRKHLSAIKGGRLAQAAFPATVMNLVISDVIGNDLESIASGTTHWDSSTFGDARGILEKHGLWASSPRGVKKAIQLGIEGKLGETLKKKDPAFKKVFTFLLGHNGTALAGARAEAERLSFQTTVLAKPDFGEAREAARRYLALISLLARRTAGGNEPRCLIVGGELTVTVKGRGRGGRNQEFILACLAELWNRRKGYNPYSFYKKYKDWLFLSLGTDGIDGPTDAAGAWIGPATIEKADSLSLTPYHFLEENDSYNFFRRVGGLIKTGPTRTNVMDLRLFFWIPRSFLTRRQQNRE